MLGYVIRGDSNCRWNQGCLSAGLTIFYCRCGFISPSCMETAWLRVVMVTESTCLAQLPGEHSGNVLRSGVDKDCPCHISK